MEVVENRVKKRSKSILKKLERYLSMKKKPSAFTKSKSWHSRTTNHNGKEKVAEAPIGCFSVYVGPEKQRFVIKTEFANHPLFKMLLDDAELDYGFHSQGPLRLPCDTHLFCRVLAEMDCGGGEDQFGQYDDDVSRGFGYGSCSPLFSPRRRLGGKSGSYALLTPPRLLKLNNRF